MKPTQDCWLEIARRSVRYGRTRALTGMLLLATLLAGCNAPFVSRGGNSDSGPARVPDWVLTQPEPVPRAEPMSASGNSLSYVVFGKRYYRLPTAAGYVAEGTASWYGRKFNGRPTASGETYDMYALTAAHRSLPLPSYARVTNLDNGKSVIVKVNDRGPFVGQRLIDLSYAAAARLDMLEAGTAPVRVTVLDGEARPADPVTTIAGAPAASSEAQPRTEAALASAVTQQPTVAAAPVTRSQPLPAVTTPVPIMAPEWAGPAFLQVGAFGSFAAADRLSATLQAALAAKVFIVRFPQDALYRVRLGPFDDPAQQRQAADTLRARWQLQPVAVDH